MGAVEEGKQALLFANVGQNLPLLVSGVDASGIVSTSVEYDHGVFRRASEVLSHAFKVDTLVGCVPVTVRSNVIATSLLKDVQAIAPSGLRIVDSLVFERLD